MGWGREPRLVCECGLECGDWLPWSSLTLPHTVINYMKEERERDLTILLCTVVSDLPPHLIVIVVICWV